MLPDAFSKRMKHLLGDDFKSYADAMEKMPERAVRINKNKASDKSVLTALPYKTEKIPYADGGYYISAGEDEKIGSHPLHHAGAFYVQEPSAMAPVCAVPIKPDFKVLDVCASPGGKSSQAAELITEGVIVSNEIIPSRAATLMGNIERQGFVNAIVTNTDSATLAEWFDGVFDLVICDAPCSGEGMFRKNPDAVTEWSEENVIACAARQREILKNAAKAVRRGGYLLYSTCTFSKDENEDVISDFLAQYDDFSLCDATEELIASTTGGIEMEKARRFYPHTARGEGQFFALMMRSGDESGIINYTDSAKKLTREEEKCVFAFLSDCFDEMPRGRLCVVGKTVCLAPDFPVPKHSVFCAGVKVGEIEKGRLVPHHQLFSALGAKMKRKVDLSCDSEDIRKYIGGETISADIPNGWCAVLCDGCAVGGAKAVDKVLKNHYPKGLRRKI